MKKQKIQLIVILVLLIVFVGGYFGLKKYNENVQAKESEPKYTALALTDQDEIESIEVTNLNGTFDIEKDENGDYYLKDNDSITVDRDKIDSKIEEIKTITSEQVVDGAENLADYGLDDPDVTVVVSLKDGESHTLYFGDFNQSASTYYLKVDDISTIYTVSSTLKSAFIFSADDIQKAEETEEAAEEASESEASETEDTETTDNSETSEDTTDN
ncbi:MAG: DUF4340 domain-containing protein [Butyrivibrio sp.]|nr:DUF4340 domain-containing protein [Butyrivibrio sp.]